MRINGLIILLLTCFSIQAQTTPNATLGLSINRTPEGYSAIFSTNGAGSVWDSASLYDADNNIVSSGTLHPTFTALTNTMGGQYRLELSKAGTLLGSATFSIDLSKIVDIPKIEFTSSSVASGIIENGSTLSWTGGFTGSYSPMNSWLAYSSSPFQGTTYNSDTTKLATWGWHDVSSIQKLSSIQVSGLTAGSTLSFRVHENDYSSVYGGFITALSTDGITVSSNSGIDYYSYASLNNISAVPEPSTYALTISAAACLFAAYKRRTKSAKK